ncbi:MAG: vitamin K epoxide reductase family protein [Acidobacteriia bacterium]|nr:vitamin K epoxide reductase family protein [Terriglobia bacterium]
MQSSLTLRGVTWPRMLSLVAGAGMMVASILTLRHFFEVNYPISIYQGSFCDISAFFNCGSAVSSPIAQILGVPIGLFGLFVGGLVVSGMVFNSAELERTNKTLSLLNLVGVLALLLYSVLWLKTLCPLCTIYYLFSFFNFFLFWKYGIDSDQAGFRSRFLRPSLKLFAVWVLLMLAGAYGMRQYHFARRDAMSGGGTTQVVEQYFALPTVKPPSVISTYWSVKSTERFEEAPVHIVEYGDFLCPDCLFLHKQLLQLRKEFPGKINVAFQFFPLEAKCNQVVEKNRHPGACELAYMAAADASKFQALNEEIFGNFEKAKDPVWRQELAKRYGVEKSSRDPAVQGLVQKIINTGAEFDKTSDKYAHGIRSTPTLIINDRMVIGTFPYAQMRALFQALIDKQEHKDSKFMENWAK